MAPGLRSEGQTLLERTKMTTIDLDRHMHSRHSLSDKTVAVLLVAGIVVTTTAWIAFLGWAGLAIAGLFN